MVCVCVCVMCRWCVCVYEVWTGPCCSVHVEVRGQPPKFLLTFLLRQVLTNVCYYTAGSLGSELLDSLSLPISP